jgi:hypothetical protein
MNRRLIDEGKLGNLYLVTYPLSGVHATEGWRDYKRESSRFLGVVDATKGRGDETSLCTCWMGLGKYIYE